MPDYATLYKFVNVANRPIVCLGEEVIYTVHIENINQRALMDVVFFDSLPAGLEFKPGTVEINGDVFSGFDPNAGFPLPNLGPHSFVDVSFTATATSVPTDIYATNIAHINFHTVDPETDLPVPDAHAESNPVSITIRDCECDEDSCERTLCKLYSIALPFTVRPFARRSIPEITCTNPMELIEGHIACTTQQREFDYTLTQQIRVELPVAFGAEVCCDDPCFEDNGQCTIIP